MSRSQDVMRFSPGPWSILRDAPTPLIIVGNDGLITGISVERLYSRKSGRCLVELQEGNTDLIVEAVNACFVLNPVQPRVAAQAYGALVTACQNVVALEMSDARRDPAVRQVIELVNGALGQARRDG